MPQMDEAWEYWQGDAEVEELLAEQANPRGLPSLARMPGCGFDNRGFRFQQAPRETKPVAVTIHRDRMMGEVICAVRNYLRTTGPNTIVGIAAATKINRESVRSALCRKAGDWFKVIGTEVRALRGRPRLIWDCTTDSERADFLSGLHPRAFYLTGQMPTRFQTRHGTWEVVRRWEHEPFPWVA